MKILTLTMNPVIDKSTQAEMVLPKRKNRCDTPVYEPGGGGINVSRAIKKLGGVSCAWYLAGGKSGDILYDLLEEEGIEQRKFDTDKDIRENLMVFDKSTSENYRFTMKGPEYSKADWDKILDEFDHFDEFPDYIVASGSLPPGVPDDFYARVGEKCKSIGAKFILDASEKPLFNALEAGVFLIKPNFREMAMLLGNENMTGMEMETEVDDFLKRSQCEILVVSLGSKGAMLVRPDAGPEYIIPPTINVNSAVGAGDSMVAGIITALVRGLDISEAVLYGVAAGTAATITEGSQLCRKDDTDKIFEWLRSSRVINTPEQ